LQIYAISFEVGELEDGAAREWRCPGWRLPHEHALPSTEDPDSQVS